MKTTLLFGGIFIAGILLLEPVTSHICNCARNLCCSKYGYCDTGDVYCGCQDGPCIQPAPTNNTDVPGIVTQSFFDGIVAKSTSNCAGRGFYTRDAFLNAIKSYPRFGRSGSITNSKREIAAFFAHVTHETGHFCQIEEIDGPLRDYCDMSNTQYPCNPNKGYYGRGPIQISWNYNYGAAGQSLGIDGLNNPEIVSINPVVSFKTALWFWMNNVHPGFTSSKGFGATIQAVNGMECNDGNTNAVNARVRYYTDYCNQFGVETGTNIRC